MTRSCGRSTSTAGRRCRLRGRFNVENALAAAAAARLLGVDDEAIAAGDRGGARRAGPVRAGRRGAAVRRHRRLRPQARRARERAARRRASSTSGRLICVFGCGGDRDRGKRPLMGEVAAELADRRDPHLRQPAQRGPDAIIDEVARRRGRRSRSSSTAARRSSARSQLARAGRRRRDRRQGPRAGPGDRAASTHAVRRPRGRAGGAAARRPSDPAAARGGRGARRAATAAAPTVDRRPGRLAARRAGRPVRRRQRAGARFVDGCARFLLLATTDPANPYGASLPWPKLEGGRRPGRSPGAHVLLRDGEPVVYVERGGRGLLRLRRLEGDGARRRDAGARRTRSPPASCRSWRSRNSTASR